MNVNVRRRMTDCSQKTVMMGHKGGILLPISPNNASHLRQKKEIDSLGYYVVNYANFTEFSDPIRE